MKLRFLGTSAGELYPGLWCRCRVCQMAREGTERDRRQSAALYIVPSSGDMFSPAEDQAVLVDFPPEIAHQAFRHRVDLTGLRYLLMTHSHGDHWCPYLLRWRLRAAVIAEDPPMNIGGPRFTALPTLHIYGNAAVEAVLYRELGSDLAPYDLAFHRVLPGDSFQAGCMSVTALRANHDIGKEEALHYICQDARSTLLYGLDGNTFLPETRELLRRFRFDAVVLESTFGHGEGGGHRNFARLTAEAEWLRNEKLLSDGGSVIATHFSPHHCPPHRQTEEFLKPYDIVTAWDGLEMSVGDAGRTEV